MSLGCLLKAALRLNFVKLPDTAEQRVFRDALTMEEPEDRSYQDLSDIVARKLSFMGITSCDFTVFYTEPTGDRLVVDDAYFGELVNGWFDSCRAERRARKRGRVEHGTRATEGAVPAFNTLSFSQEAQRPVYPSLIGSPDDHVDGDGGRNSGRSSRSSSVSSSGDRSANSDGDDLGAKKEGRGGLSASLRHHSGARTRGSTAAQVQVCFEIEVSKQRREAVRNDGHEEPSGPVRYASGESLSSMVAVTPPGLVIASDVARPSVSASGYSRPGGAAAADCAPLTVENLSALVKQNASPAAHDGPRGDDRGWSRGALLTAPTALATAVAIPDHSDTLVRVGDLVCPPQPANFYLRCVVVDVRFKAPKQGLSIVELELCDATDVSQLITGVTFDATVHKQMRETLRGDGRQVVELRRVYVRRKTDVDMRYATNAHPLLLRIDRNSKIEVVQVLTVPLTARMPALVSSAIGGSGGGPSSGAVVSIRDPTTCVRGGGLVELTELSRLGGGAGSDYQASLRGVPRAGAGDAWPYGSRQPTTAALPAHAQSSSSSSSTGARRTTFTFGSGHAGTAFAGTPAAVSGVVPSMLGVQLQRQQQQIVQRPLSQGEATPFEPGVIAVTRKDVQAREALIEHDANREAMRKDRIRRKSEVSQTCILCGLDLETDTDTAMALVHRLLEANTRNKGGTIPTLEELRVALSDARRPARPGSTAASGGLSGRKKPGSTRLACLTHFVNLHTKATHIVHARCAHLCTAYQNGGDLEDIVLYDLDTQLCSLCGLPGAFVSCYHPDCKEAYHAVCALYSGGYVNFGKRDPYLPCPACPRHTQVSLSRKQRGTPATGCSGDDDGGNHTVLHVDNSCWEDDNVAFDSRVVAAGDLRDPDENDGE